MARSHVRRSALWGFADDWLRPRVAYALPLLLAVAIGPALHLGGAPAISVPIWASVALAALAMTGVDVPALRRDRLALAAAVAVGVSVLQLVPLPSGLLGWIDARSAQVSAGALAPLRIDRAHVARALHLDPGSGLADLHYFIGLAAAYLAAKRATHRGHGSVLLTGAAVAPLLIALLALVHKGIGLDKVYGVYSPVQAAPPIFSPILNPNHLAAFVGAGAILWVGRYVEDENPASRVVDATCALLCGATCALSLSRGGVAATLGGLLLFALSVRWVRQPSLRRSGQRLFSIAIGISVATSAGAYVAFEALRAEYAIRDTSKLGMIVGALRPLRQHLWFGVGSGGLHAAVAAAGTLPGDYTVERAESLPADLALAFGPIAATGILVLAGIWLWRVRPSARAASPQLVAAFCALASLVVHDMVDFALWFGASGYLAAVLAGVLAGEAQSRAAPMATRPRPARRALVFVAMAASAVAGIVTASAPLYVARNRLEALAGTRPVPEAALRSELVRHPGDPYLPLLGAAIALRAGDGRALRFVNRALELSPTWAAPHTLLARALAARGYRAQALVEIRYSAGLSDRGHSSLATLLLALRPTRDELDRAAAPGALGLHLLRTFASVSSGRAESADADALLLARAPDDLEALSREAVRAHGRGELAAEGALWERVVRGHPEAAAGYLGLADLARAAGDLPREEAALRRGIAHTGESEAYLLRFADVQTRRRDVPAMRATMSRALEAVGADIDGRIRVYGALGQLEERLQNDAASLAAYERADAMAYPEHPYLEAVVLAAQRLHNVSRVHGACIILAERGAVRADLRNVCSAAGRVAAPVGATPPAETTP